MAKKPGTNPKGEFAFFNVVYEDDSQRSNRRVPAELLGGLDGDEPARGFIMEQDREISEKAGTSIDAGGKPVSPEMLLDMMSAVQMEFEPDGTPSQSFVIHPDMFPALKKVSDQIENDPELKRKNTEILERQREAWAARESNRKLVD